MTLQAQVPRQKSGRRECKANVQEWSDLNILQRIANVGNRIYARHQTDLADLYTARTMAVAWQFARSLAHKLLGEIQNMDADISTFAEKAITDTETPFVNFGRLAADISIDDIRDAFDIKLSEIVRAKHNEKAESDKKVEHHHSVAAEASDGRRD